MYHARPKLRAPASFDARSITALAAVAVTDAIGCSRTRQREAKVSHSRLLGHEILRRVTRADVPANYPLDSRTDRVVLGALEGRYLVPPGIDILDLGLIDGAGRFELLPIDRRDSSRARASDTECGWHIPGSGIGRDQTDEPATRE